MSGIDGVVKAVKTGRARPVGYVVRSGWLDSGWVCLECGKRFKTVAAASRAADRGCPRCGGVDIDLK